jgi:putative SOS response-associated peptidase YedK
MCGRFTLMGRWQDVYAFLGVVEGEPFPPRYNIAPTQPILMASAGAPRQPGSNLPDRQSLLVRWGFIPAWARDPRAMPPMFNARSETAAGLASFKAAMRHRRTLVPASGFYEWMTAGKSKQPFFVRPRHGGLIAFAGLMETYADRNGSEIDTGAVLTTHASDDIAAIHPRTPVVIQPEDFMRWLDCRTQEPRDVIDLMRPAPLDFFEAIPVSDLINSAGNTGPDVQERMTNAVPVKPRAKGQPEDSGQLSLL